MATPVPDVHLLLYDGDCGLCSRVVQFVLRRDPTGRFHFATLQGDIGRRIVEQAGGDPDLRSSLYVVPHYRRDPGRPLTKSDAALFVASELGGALRVVAMARALPRSWRDRAYDVVARHRHGVPASGDQCLLPAPDVRARFVDETRPA